MKYLNFLQWNSLRLAFLQVNVCLKSHMKWVFDLTHPALNVLQKLFLYFMGTFNKAVFTTD